MIILALTHHDGIRLAELGLALTAIAGVAFFFSALVPERAKPGVLVAGGTLAVGAVLILIAVHWGRFG
jgi:hypothetical protein